MLFRKLPIVFLSALVSENDGSTNCHIASFILENLDSVKSMSISEIAAICHVSVSSVSRFCKEVGLEDYSELKEILSDARVSFEVVSTKENAVLRVDDYKTKVADSLELVASSLDYTKIAKLCNDIECHNKVSVFGLMKGETAAINLQSDLLMLDKIANTKVSFPSQMEYLKSAKEDELVIIFSYTGSYLDYFGERAENVLKRPKVYFITSDRNTKADENINEVIHFDSKQDQSSHPYQLLFISSIISQEYARLKRTSD